MIGQKYLHCTWYHHKRPGRSPVSDLFFVKHNPFKIFNRLKDRYYVSTIAMLVQFLSRLSIMTYRNESMQDYVDGFDEL